MAQTLQQVRDELRDFRKAHGHTAHVPETLRKAVVRLCDSHTRGAITRDVGLGWNTLLRWIEIDGAGPAAATRTASAAKVKAKVKEPKNIGFVEIKGATPFQLAAPLTEGPASSTIEVTRPDGWTVRVTGELAKDFAGAMLGKFTL